jgi:hypothetical protein
VVDSNDESDDPPAPPRKPSGDGSGSGSDDVGPSFTSSNPDSADVSSSDEEIVSGNVKARATVQRETVWTHRASIPVQIEGCKIRVESFVNFDGVREYCRIGVLCPLRGCKHKQAGKVCRKWRNLGDAQTSTYGQAEAIGFLACWLRQARAHATFSLHMKYVPSLAEIGAYIAEDAS